MRGTRPLRQCSRHHNYRLTGEFDFNDYAACTALGWTEWLPANLEMFVAHPPSANASSKKNRRLIAKINRLFENSKHRARLQMHAEERISRPVALSFQ